jgi:hypothetical protein
MVDDSDEHEDEDESMDESDTLDDDDADWERGKFKKRKMNDPDYDFNREEIESFLIAMVTSDDRQCRNGNCLSNSH